MNLRRSASVFCLVLLSVVLFAGHSLASSSTGRDSSEEIGLQYFVPPPLEAQLSSDGKALRYGVAPVVYVADPNPPKERLRIPAPLNLLALSESASAAFSITYIAAGGMDAWGQPCYAFPENAKAAFNAAAAVWASLVTSSVPITIEACWASLSGGTLGYSGGGNIFRDFTNAPRAHTWYSAALADSFAGHDLDSSNANMHITYNQNFNWYFGTDGNTPASQYDFLSAVLHEITHGLNFSGSMSYAGGQGNWGYGIGYPDIYDTFIQDSSGNSLINTTVYHNPSTALGSALTSNNIWFSGSNAMAANGGNRVKIYAPSVWDDGSSYSHLDYSTFAGTANRLMVYAISSGTSIHDPGPVARGLLQDLGWSISASPPPAATLVAPSGTICTNAPTYTWNAVPNATSYYLWVNDSTGNGINQWYTAAQAGCSNGTGTCAVTPDIALAMGSGNWLVRTYNSSGFGPWSQANNFTVALIPPTANLISPSGTICTNVPTYIWNAVSNATSYYLWVNDSTGNRIKQWYTPALAGCSGGTGTCAVTPDTALEMGSGEWRVQTYNACGYGSWSDSSNFTVALIPPAATLISPSGTITTNAPTYTWDAVSNSTWYYLWVNDSTGNRIKQWYTAAQAGCSSGSGTCSVWAETALAAGAAKWWIQTWNDCGYGPWSDALKFKVAPADLPGKATLIWPAGMIGTNTSTYAWNAVPNTNWYYLWVYESTEYRIKQWYSAAQAGCPSGAGTCAVTPDTALAMGSGKWWIQTYNSSGFGPWSDGLVFTATIPGKVSLISPSGTIGTNAPTYTWNAISNATWYYLWVNDSTGNRIKQWYTAPQAGCSGGIGTCSLWAETALVAGSSKWWIQTWNAFGYGPWSDAMSFAAAPADLPGKATLIWPAGIIGAKTPTYTWDAVSNANWYYLWVYDSTGYRIKQWCSAAQAGCPGGTGMCSITPDTALDTGSGKWWVQTYNPSGFGPWSDANNFTVAMNPPAAATLISPSGTIHTTQPTYTWNAVSSSTWYYLWVNGPSGNMIKQWYTAAQANCSTGAGTCSVTPDMTLGLGNYTWWIQTRNANGDGPWSTANHFMER